MTVKNDSCAGTRLSLIFYLYKQKITAAVRDWGMSIQGGAIDFLKTGNYEKEQRNENHGTKII
jgi:hypothetical protein